MISLSLPCLPAAVMIVREVGGRGCEGIRNGVSNFVCGGNKLECYFAGLIRE